VDSISADQARLIALWSQGFVTPIEGATPGAVQRMGKARRGDVVHAMLRRLGAVQCSRVRMS
jgi:hypothetical protein